jgi:hypothetical protein
MSNTPRTDALLKALAVPADDTFKNLVEKTQRHADFTRELERELFAARAAALSEGIMVGKLSQRLLDAHNMLLQIKKTIRHQSMEEGECYGCEIASKIDALVFLPLIRRDRDHTAIPTV